MPLHRIKAWALTHCPLYFIYSYSRQTCTTSLLDSASQNVRGFLTKGLEDQAFTLNPLDVVYYEPQFKNVVPLVTKNTWNIDVDDSSFGMLGSVLNQIHAREMVMPLSDFEDKTVQVTLSLRMEDKLRPKVLPPYFETRIGLTMNPCISLYDLPTGKAYVV